jgi:hypothetical protein
MALVSGLPSNKRADRRLMVLQAFFDDSGNEPTSPIFVLAGLVTTHERWARFSEEWRAVLDGPPRLDYFKMAEAESLRKQFSIENGWNKESRDDLVLRLAGIVFKHVIGGIHASISHESFDRWIRSIKNPTRNTTQDHPYFALFHAVVQITSFLQIRSFQNHPCDLIFDEQGSLGLDAIHYWENLRRIEAPNKDVADVMAGYSGNPPNFRNEKEFLPLQAADLYAWQLRRRFVERGRAPARPALIELEKIAAMEMDLSDEMLRDLSRHLVDVREKFIKDRPGIRLFGLGEGPRRKPLGKRG